MEEGRLVERSTERELAVVEEEEERNEFDCIEQMKTKKNNEYHYERREVDERREWLIGCDL